MQLLCGDILVTKRTIPTGLRDITGFGGKQLLWVFACFLLKRDPSIILVIIPDTAVRSYTAAVLRTVEAELSCATGLYSQGKQSASSAI